MSAIGTAQTGLPVNITIDRANSAVPGNFAISGSTRPNLVPGISLTPVEGSTPDNWINPSAFSVPASGTFGNLGRNAFRAPGISQLDLGVSKFHNVDGARFHPPSRQFVQRLKPGPVWRAECRSRLGEQRRRAHAEFQFRCYYEHDHSLCHRARYAA